MAFWGKKETAEDSKVKKPGFIRRLWRKIRGIDWKNPANRWRLLFGILFGTIAMLGLSWGAIEFTNTPSFCSNCHEMAPEHTTFEASAHNQISCVQCHVKPGLKNELFHKVEAMKEVYYHVVGAPNPIVQTVPVTNENCLQCHSKNRLVSATGDLKVNHKGHIQKAKIPCITCHAGVIHGKVVERGLNHQGDLKYWTKENIDKLVNKKYTSPNMGTCIDCHNKVNNGEKPWKDIAYSLPENPEEHGEKNGGHLAESASTEILEGNSVEQAAIEKTETQNIILQAIGKQKKNMKISMECSTCHKEVATPKNHDRLGWNENHGEIALTNLDKCMNCHQDSKWVRKLPKENILDLLNANKKEKYVADIKVVKDHSRENTFCSTCHSKRPPGHVDSDKWLTYHSSFAKTDEDKAQCSVCHDRSKPQLGAEKPKAPTDVYCEYCHRTGFKEEKNS